MANIIKFDIMAPFIGAFLHQLETHLMLCRARVEMEWAKASHHRSVLSVRII